ncbi:hypothetical protein HNO92_001980 [Chromobacterium alkanivorans]|uniref:hypothetical protein n=1 Tax=Chromobacterium alkanivorans TaxID=1071719 RepID=UPI0021691D97|nr:hypothetical protein [Chromobacterium alkanivorans]MCS3804388.1 hypothetical protein [Chromobacterium alkanivorans]MCS3818392.1 hypothetical protein [Chromobacterium alkanivorans]MCS3873672.1 hypothetical protein [Chromobacterium alkanivorans]
MPDFLEGMKSIMAKANKRQQGFDALSDGLGRMSDETIKSVVANGDPVHVGMGGRGALIRLDGKPVFVKRIALTDLELEPSRFLSTENHFELPLRYQYGIGSVGFGAWRELAAHRLVSEQARRGDSPCCPLLYHWRVLRDEPTGISLAAWESLETYCAYWDGEEAIRRRVMAIQDSSSSLFLFMEYVPQTLFQWLGSKVGQGESAASAILAMERQLEALCADLREMGMAHFDLHFANLLTDGERIYLSDFGLALSDRFVLSGDEADFLAAHHGYDAACASLSLVHCLIAHAYERHDWFGVGDWVESLDDYLRGDRRMFPAAVGGLLDKHAAAAVRMDAFFHSVRRNKSQVWPAL